jgi:hypothetical protein
VSRTLGGGQARCQWNQMTSKEMLLCEILRIQWMNAVLCILKSKRLGEAEIVGSRDCGRSVRADAQDYLHCRPLQ